MLAGGPEELDRAAARRFGLVCEVMVAAPICTVLLNMSLLAGPPAWLASIVGSQAPSRIQLWVGQLLGVWITAAGWWPFALLLALALAHCLAVFPARLAAFPKYPAAQRENLITAAHYLAGALLIGGVIGMIAGVMVAALSPIVFFSAARPPWHVLAGVMAVTATLVGGSIWLAAGFRYFRHGAWITGTSIYRVLGFGLMLTGLWIGVWAVLMPLCVGLMVLIYRTW